MKEIILKIKKNLQGIKERPWTLITKPLGLIMIWPAIPFRAYARNVVYNYVLQQGDKTRLPRLWQRKPISDGLGWTLQDMHAVGRNGYVHGHARIISRIHYLAVVFLIWGWLDDDSNEDTTDWYHIKRTHPKCIEGVEYPTYGNTFDLGDVRASWPFFKPCATLLWTLRNSAMNFQYLGGY